MASAGHTYTQPDAIMLSFRPFFSAAVALLAMTTVACDRDDDAPEVALPLCPSPEIVELPSDDMLSGRASIEEIAWRDDGCVEVAGRYGGGCAEDELRVALTPLITIGHTPYVPYRLEMYDAADDPCEAIESGSALVSLDELRAERERIALTIHGDDETSYRILLGPCMTRVDFGQLTGGGDRADTASLAKRWLLREVGGISLADSSLGRTPELQFEVARGLVSGMDGWNSLRGTMSMEIDPDGTSGALAIDGFASTRAASGWPAEEFAAGLLKACRFELIQGDSLVLYTEAGEPRLRLRAAE